MTVVDDPPCRNRLSLKSGDIQYRSDRKEQRQGLAWIDRACLKNPMIAALS